MCEDLTVRLLMLEYKLDTATDRQLFKIDIILKIAGLFMLTASLWVLAIQSGGPPTHPLYVPISLCIGTYILAMAWFARNFYRFVCLIWDHKIFFTTDLEKKCLSDNETARCVADRFESASLKACQLELEFGAKRFEKDVAALGPLRAASGAVTVVLALLGNTLPRYWWISTIVPAFMFGAGTAAILKLEFIKQLIRYDFIVRVALRLKEDK